MDWLSTGKRLVWDGICRPNLATQDLFVIVTCLTALVSFI